MTSKESIFYAFGQLAYAVCKVDGKIQHQETERLQQLMQERMRNHGMDIDVAEIIFHLLSKDNMDTQTVYDWALKELKLHAKSITKGMRVDMVIMLRDIADSFNSVSGEEKKLIDRFAKDIYAI